MKGEPMRSKCLLVVLTLVSSLLLLSSCNYQKSKTVSRKPYPEEIKVKINRGLVCFPKDETHIFLSWRLLPTDPKAPKFYIWHKDMDKAGAEAKMIATTNQTCFVDSGLEKGHTYAYSIQVNMESEPKNFQENFVE